MSYSLASSRGALAAAALLTAVVLLATMLPVPVLAATIFSDSFGTSNSDTITGWSQADGDDSDTEIRASSGSSNNSVSPDGGAFAVAGGDGGWFCRTVDATGYNALQLSYHWRGDTQAESSDEGVVEYKTDGSCSDPSEWTQLQAHVLTASSTWTTQGASSLPEALVNSSFLLRFRADSSDDNEDFRVDGISLTGTAALSSQTITVTTPAPSSAAYGSSGFSVAATASSGLAVAITTTGGCAVVGNMVTMTSGTTDCVVRYNQAGNDSYSAAPEVTQTVTTSQKALTVQNIAAANKTYDGTTAATLLNLGGVTLVGVVGGDDVSLDASGAAGTFSDKNAGDAKTVTISGLALTGEDAGNYALTPPTALADITKRSITITATGIDKAYDGTTSATVTLGTNAVLGDDVVAQYTSAEFSGADIGTDIPIHVTGISITGTDASNYNPPADSADTSADITEFAIEKAPQTIDFGALGGKIAGDVDFDVSATASSGLPVSFSASGACSVSGSTVHLTSIGSCTITAHQAGNDNYLAAADVERSFEVIEMPPDEEPPPEEEEEETHSVVANPITSGGGLITGGQVLGAALGPEVSTTTSPAFGNGKCSADALYLTPFIRSGAKNDSGEVKKLQQFLNQELGVNLPLTGFYGPLSKKAVKKFQEKYPDQIIVPWARAGFSLKEGTGYVYKTTQRWINILYCGLPHDALSLTLP